MTNSPRGTEVHVALVRGPIVAAGAALNNEATPAIGLACIASAAQQAGYSVQMVDAVGEGLNQIHELEARKGFVTQGLTNAEVIGRLSENTSVIGFSTMFSGEWPVNRDLVKAVRSRFPQALLVAGGEHVTALPEYCLRDCPELDVIVKGEGDQTFVEVLDAFRSGTDLADVAGIAYLGDDGALVNTGGVRRIRDINELGWPSWPEGYLEKFWEAGKSYGVHTVRDMPMIASRGCPYQCTFCSSPAMWTTKYVLRDIDDLIAEIESSRDRYGITAIQFYDLTAITKKRWVLEFCDKLEARGIDLKWSLPSGTRSEVLDEETLTRLRDTNCNYLVYAPESGSPVTLERIQKRIKLERITDSMRTAKRLGLTVRANLIIGFPKESRRDMFRTLLYGLKLSAIGVDEVPVFIFSAYPGTEIFRELTDSGAVAVDDDYLFALQSLNSDFRNFRPRVFTSRASAIELGLYRTGFMVLNYLVGYVLFPSRILRSIRNVFFPQDLSGAATVLEHRVRDAMGRRRAKATRSS